MQIADTYMPKYVEYHETVIQDHTSIIDWIAGNPSIAVSQTFLLLNIYPISISKNIYSYIYT